MSITWMRLECIRRAAVLGGSFGRLVLRLRAQAMPGRLLGLARLVDARPRVGLHPRVVADDDDVADGVREPLPLVAEALDLRLEPGLGDRRRHDEDVVTSGWRPNHAIVCSFQLRHSSARDFGVRLTTRAERAARQRVRDPAPVALLADRRQHRAPGRRVAVADQRDGRLGVPWRALPTSTSARGPRRAGGCRSFGFSSA